LKLSHNDAVRKKLEADIKAYLAKGGKITKVPIGCGKKTSVEFVTRKKQETYV
jgi:hypothetical protein